MGFYRHHSRIKPSDELSQKPMPCYFCLRMHFASVFPAANSKLNWMVSSKLVRWGKGKVTLRQDNSFKLFYFSSVKEEGKWGAVGNRWRPAGN